ncbi:MAG: PhoH family protein [Clostridiales bacterium]|nr:PhoH family protein [Clostridiales bacterium]
MLKTFVLDTNVLIQSPYSILSFEENNLVLPIVCLEELDDMKNDDGERGSNARECIRVLERLRLGGNLLDGVPLPNGGTLRIEQNYSGIELPSGFHASKHDNRLLKVCIGIANEQSQTILVTKDILLRLKAQLIGIDAQDFTTEQSPAPSEQYTGRAEVYTADEKLAGIKKKGIDPKDVYLLSGEEKKLFEPVVNQFIIVRSEVNERKTILARFNGTHIIPLSYIRKEPFGVKPKNVGQYFLQEALMTSAEEAPLVIVKGAAGTAKTFYSLAVGMEKMLEADEREYRKILLTRPNVQFDEDIGFLPGSEQEKIAPFLRPAIDNLELLVDRNEKERYKSEKELHGKIDELFDRGIIAAEAMNFIRGRTITHTYLIIDEAQNLTPKQAKGLITRVGRGTKIILLGDPQQIDHPLLDERTNGLSFAGERMKGSSYCWQITMLQEECERSVLAADAANRM